MGFGNNLNRSWESLGDWLEEESACLIGRGEQIFLNLPQGWSGEKFYFFH